MIFYKNYYIIYIENERKVKATMENRSTFGELLRGPFTVPVPPGSTPPVYLKLDERYQKTYFNAIRSNGEPYFFEDEEEVIPLCSLKGDII